MTEETYIGDGVYASFDGYHVWLKCERMDGGKHEIALEPEVLESLKLYADRVRKRVVAA